MLKHNYLLLNLPNNKNLAKLCYTSKRR